MKKFFLKLACLILLVAVGFLGFRYAELRRDNQTLRETVAQLEQERRALQRQLTEAGRAPKPEDQLELRREIEEQTSALRGLPFKGPVNYKTMEREEFHDYLIAKLKEHYTDAEIRDYSRSLAALGLVPEGTDLLAAVLSLYSEQVGAFYVPEERALYTFKGLSLSSGLDGMFLAHELTHALQDQNFDLTKFPLNVKDNDDLQLATSALIEGDATMLMTQFYAQHADPGRMLGDVAAMLQLQTTALLEAPPFLRAMLLFPYEHGQEFAMALYLAGGTKALDDAFRNPPVSTKEILHPGKYLSSRQPPERIELPVIESQDWRLIGNNVLGEFGIRFLLGQHLGVVQAQIAADGWNGDRYYVYERGTNGPMAFVWVSAWETGQDAEQFEEAYNNMIDKRAGQPAVLTRVHRNGARVSIAQSTDPGFIDLAKPEPMQ
jgi:hypothetical protein